MPLEQVNTQAKRQYQGFEARETTTQVVTHRKPKCKRRP